MSKCFYIWCKYTRNLLRHWVRLNKIALHLIRATTILLLGFSHPEALSQRLYHFQEREGVYQSLNEIEMSFQGSFQSPFLRDGTFPFLPSLEATSRRFTMIPQIMTPVNLHNTCKIMWTNEKRDNRPYIPAILYVKHQSRHSQTVEAGRTVLLYIWGPPSELSSRRVRVYYTRKHTGANVFIISHVQFEAAIALGTQKVHRLTQ